MRWGFNVFATAAKKIHSILETFNLGNLWLWRWHSLNLTLVNKRFPFGSWQLEMLFPEGQTNYKAFLSKLATSFDLQISKSSLFHFDTIGWRFWRNNILLWKKGWYSKKELFRVNILQIGWLAVKNFIPYPLAVSHRGEDGKVQGCHGPRPRAFGSFGSQIAQ